MEQQTIVTTEYEIVPMARRSSLIGSPSILDKTLKAMHNSGLYDVVRTPVGVIFSDSDNGFNVRISDDGSLRIDDFVSDEKIARKRVEFLLANSVGLRLEDEHDSLLYRSTALYGAKN